MQLLTLAVNESLVLQPLEGLLQANDVARRVVTEVASHRFDVHFGQSLRCAGLSQELFETLQLSQLLGDRGALGEGTGVVAAHPVRPIPIDVRRRHAQRCV